LNHSQCVVGQLEPERRGHAHRSDRQHKQHAHQQGYIGQRALDSDDATEDCGDVHDLEDENAADHYHQRIADNVEHEVPEGVRALPSEVGGDKVSILGDTGEAHQQTQAVEAAEEDVAVVLLPVQEV